MFVILLKFSANRDQASQFMEGHMAWVKKGFDDGVFLMAGSLKPDLGGGIMAHRCSMEELQARLDADPFVQENVVSPEIFEIAPARLDERLDFLKD